MGTKIKPAPFPYIGDHLKLEETEFGKSKKELLEEFSSIYLKCDKCPLHKNKFVHRKVMGTGHIRSDIMIIGMSPGKEEDEEGVPFVGPTGNKLQEVLQECGLWFNTVWRTNLVLCRAAEVKMGKKNVTNREPSDLEIKACLERLNKEIYIVDPKIILMLGGAVSDTLIGGKANLSKYRGEVTEIVIKGKHGPVPYAAMPIYHPSYLVKQGAKSSDRTGIFPSMVNEINKAKKLASEFSFNSKKIEIEERHTWDLDEVKN